MKNLKKISRQNLSQIKGSASCGFCPPGPYGPGMTKSCDEFHSLPDCCKSRVIVSYECFPQ